MSLKKTLQLNLIGLCLLSATGGAMADVAVIMSAKNPAGTLSASQVSDIFLGKGGNLPSGIMAVPIDQTEGVAVRNEFYEKNSSKNAAQLKAHWAKIVFTGKGQPPKVAGDSAAVKKMIADNPNMIGYIEPGAVDSSVRVLLTVP